MDHEKTAELLALMIDQYADTFLDDLPEGWDSLDLAQQMVSRLAMVVRE